MPRRESLPYASWATGGFCALGRRGFHLPRRRTPYEHRQDGRWSSTSSVEAESVKANAPAFLASFPLLAVSANARHAGIVCLDFRLRPITARSVRVRRARSKNGRIAVLIAELDREIERHAPATLVIEACVVGAPGVDLAAAVARRAAERGVPCMRLSLADACLRIADRPRLRDAAQGLIARYPPLAVRLAPDGRPRLRDHDRWREARPILSAFCLAHAAAVATLATHARHERGGPPSKRVCP